MSFFRDWYSGRVRLPVFVVLNRSVYLVEDVMFIRTSTFRDGVRDGHIGYTCNSVDGFHTFSETSEVDKFGFVMPFQECI